MISRAPTAPPGLSRTWMPRDAFQFYQRLHLWDRRLLNLSVRYVLRHLLIRSRHNTASCRTRGDKVKFVLHACHARQSVSANIGIPWLQVCRA